MVRDAEENENGGVLEAGAEASVLAGVGNGDNGDNGGRTWLWLPIEDEASWLRQHGIQQEPHYGSESYKNQQEAKEKVRSQKNYQQQIHQKIFGSEDDEFQRAQQNKRTRLEDWKSQKIVFLTATTKDQSQSQSQSESQIKCDLSLLASHSDTVFAMALSRPYYDSHRHADNNSNKNTNSSSKHNNHSRNNDLSLSLIEYPEPAVAAFVKLVEKVGRLDRGNSPQSTESMLPSMVASLFEKDEEKEETEEDDGNHWSCWIVDCFKIAHYLQCTELVQSMEQVLIESIDLENCLSLVSLADQLQLPTLLEASLGYMLQKLDTLEDHEIYSDLSTELKQRITTMKQLLLSTNTQGRRLPRTSKGTRVRHLFFSSFKEYIALFAEQIDYYKERLEEAEQSQLSSPRESPGWKYAHDKIVQQSERIKVLKLVLAEQKQLFLTHEPNNDYYESHCY